MRKSVRFTMYRTKHYFHFWLIPSIEVDWELFDQWNGWLHITISWLIWGINIEFEK